MAKKKQKFKLPKIKKVHLKVLKFLGIGIIPFVVFFGLYLGKVYPGVIVASRNLSGRTPEEAIKILSGFTPPSEVNLTSKSDTDQNFKIPTNSFDLAFDYNKTADAAFRFGRSGNIIYDLGQITKALFNEKELGFRLIINEEKLSTSIFTIAGQVGTDPIYPSAKLENNKLIINKGQKGTVLDANELRILIGSNLAKNHSTPIEIPIETIDPTLNPFQEAVFQKRAEAISKKLLKLKFEFQGLEYSGNDLLSLLNGGGGFNEEALNKLTTEVATAINRAPQEAKFVFNPNLKRVDTFQPSKDGVSVKTEELANKISEALTQTENTEDKEILLDIPVELTSPKTQTGDGNNLGINELIGRGESIFYGSIASRVFNVGLAASRISGTLVAPGESFSFNQTVGDISELTGYRKAYIIENGKTVLGDGGGVCQVSTTLFRAVLNAGLPVVSRTPHAYRVGYYEQDAPPGIDATVFSPTVDFKFKNDTSSHILIQAYPNLKNYALVFEIYGTKDGRTSEIGKPIILSTTAPPPDTYQDDPTLPIGTVKQTEHRALGTKMYFNYTVIRNGEVINKQDFYSTYRPWGNIFLRGTGI